MVFLGMILGSIISKKGRLQDLKKIEAIDSSMRWDGTILQMFCQKLYYYYATYHLINQKDKLFFG
jgi:hypothetical protein